MWISNTSWIVIYREPSNTQPLRWGLEVCLRFCIQRASCGKLKQRIKVEKCWWSQPALWEWGCERRCQLRQPTHAEPVATSTTKILIVLIGIYGHVFFPGHTPCLSYRLLLERSVFRISCQRLRSVVRDCDIVESGDCMNIVFTGRWDSRVVYRNI
jgi:hypothetical protein